MWILRYLLAGAIALAPLPTVHAQAANEAAVQAAQRDAMGKLSWMNGQWKGVAVIFSLPTGVTAGHLAVAE